MFRNPRENADLPSSSSPLKPSVGRPPSPTSSIVSSQARSRRNSSAPFQKTLISDSPGMATKTTSKQAKTPLSAKSANTTAPSPKATTTKKPSSGKAQSKANGSILNFFKKSEADNGLFLGGKVGGPSNFLSEAESNVELYIDDEAEAKQNIADGISRYNESGASVKRRKTEDGEALAVRDGAASIPPPTESKVDAEGNDKEHLGQSSAKTDTRNARKSGPFVDDSDSEDDTPVATRRSIVINTNPPKTAEANISEADQQSDSKSHKPEMPIPEKPPPELKREETSYGDVDGFDDFEGLEDFEFDEFPAEGEEYLERRWAEEQRRLEMTEEGFDEDDREASEDKMRPEAGAGGNPDVQSSVATCPICGASFKGISEQQASVHVNNCLDGNPTPLPKRESPQAESKEVESEKADLAARFKRPARPARPGQQNPFTLGETNGIGSSAFSRLMSGHAEDAAWATAAAAEHAARGKPAYQRTCPFYKILPGFSICVDAFRYGAVEGCQAYFLSHFHSDHYIGLTSHWCHGPIYCSRVTGNLVRQQLRVDPKWVVDLEFEEKREVSGANGVEVTMIPANHCPGSSLFLFEKIVGKGKNPKVQRVLHCGDFRACRAHIEHPLLRPNVIDAISGKSKQQKIDVCYLDTTYLNPKYAFPSQQNVIQACADMCVSLNKSRVDGQDGWEQMKRTRAGSGMVKFVRKESDPPIKQEDEQDDAPNGDDMDATKVSPPGASNKQPRGRLLVIVGTYSIGKERICLGIAQALDSKIYAPAGKQRICACLEDGELNARLTSNPREAQVHMTPLFEIRADTLDDYLKDYRDCFSRAVGFRPSGWNYRPPNSRFVESPSVATVLNSENWKSSYSMRELVSQRGSTSRASCFGVPYSEHSSFRELTMFCCALRIEKVIPTVNVGSAKSRGKMKEWCERWAVEKRKNGLWKVEDGKW